MEEFPDQHALQKALAYAERACLRLDAFLAAPIVNGRDRAGTIKGFELTWEASWKLLQKIAVFSGCDARSPQESFVAGYRLRLCSSKKIWDQMLQERLLTSEIYRPDIAGGMVERIAKVYAGELRSTMAKARQAIESWASRVDLEEQSRDKSSTSS
jgi:nucleotidyltransferase substrate binding protein (TIGR01987 family)